MGKALVMIGVVSSVESTNRTTSLGRTRMVSMYQGLEGGGEKGQEGEGKKGERGEKGEGREMGRGGGGGGGKRVREERKGRRGRECTCLASLIGPTLDRLHFSRG